MGSRRSSTDSALRFSASSACPIMFVVDAGVNRPPENPLASASEGWLLGSAEFAERIKRLMKLPKYCDEVPAARRLQSVAFGRPRGNGRPLWRGRRQLCTKHSKRRSREIAAWLAHTDCVRSLPGRAEAAMQQSVKLKREVEHLRDRIRDGTRGPISQKKHEKRV